MTYRFFLILPLLAACGTPQERCIQRETRDLRTVDKLISESEANLERGYALEQVTIYRPEWRQCEAQPAAIPTPGAPPPSPQLCLEDVPETVTRPKAINLADERETLAELRKKRKELANRAERSIAECRAQYPE